MKNFTDKIIWITGASSGIGEEMAQRLNERGAIVILSSRKADSLREVASNLTYPEKSMVLPMDMEKQEEFPVLVDKILAQYGRIDLLFNNAGISQRSYLKDTSLEVDRRLMEINYFGTVALTKAVLPTFRKQKHGYIAVTSSLAGKFGFYQRSAYSASKFALHGFFETLRLEEDENNIGVSLFCPAGIKTNISQHALDGNGNSYGKSSELQEEGMSVQECVKQMISAIQKDKEEVIIGQGMEPLSVKIKALFPSLFISLLKKKKPTAQ